MNSLFQQLFLIPGFRNDILSVKDTQENVSEEENVLYQIQWIFSHLKWSEKPYTNAKMFCKAFKNWEGNSINVMEQMDVDEFFNTFMDRIENLLKDGKHNEMIPHYFGVTQVNEVICKECNYRSERDEACLAVCLGVKNRKNLFESLEYFIQGETLEGENAYECSRCSKKVSAVKRLCIKKLPRTLILMLRRFEFDFDTMTKSKVNDHFDFPIDLNMEPFTQEGLTRREQGNEEMVRPKEYYEYKLKGVIIHMGTSESGHYYSLIQDREKPEQKWYEFNDTFVRSFDIKDLASEAFGGQEKWSMGIGTAVREKSRNAYILFYERVNYDFELQELQKAENQYQPSGEKSQSGEFNLQISELPVNVRNIYDKIKIENYSFWRNKHTYAKEYFSFLPSILKKNIPKQQVDFNLSELKPETQELCDFSICRLGMASFLTTILRAKDKENVVTFIPILEQLIESNIKLCI